MLVKFYEFNLIKIAIAKKINNTPTTISAIFKISEIVDLFELFEILLTLVDVCESDVEVEVEAEVEVGAEVEVVVDVTDIPEFVFPELISFCSVFIDIASSIVELPDVDGVVDIVDEFVDS